jgi:hypothetical protein
MQAIELIWQYERPAEADWIRFLLSDFVRNDVVDGRYQAIAPNSVVVLSSRRLVPREYIERAARTSPCILFHISDESFHGHYDDYKAFNFVFRNFGSSAFDSESIKVLPLGFSAGAETSGPSRLASQRCYAWSFIGTDKASRPEMLHALKTISPNFVHLRFDGRAPRAIDRDDYRRIMRASAFCPCPMGNVNLETPRFYDALEAGSIPIVERRLTLACYARLFPDCPVPTVGSWTEAAALIARLRADPPALDACQQRLADWWRSEKSRLKAEVTQIIRDCFFEGRRTGKVRRGIRPIGRLPGWRQLELLRHHSAPAVLRRAKLELTRVAQALGRRAATP